MSASRTATGRPVSVRALAALLCALGLVSALVVRPHSASHLHPHGVAAISTVAQDQPGQVRSPHPVVADASPGTTVQLLAVATAGDRVEGGPAPTLDLSRTRAPPTAG